MTIASILRSERQAYDHMVMMPDGVMQAHQANSIAAQVLASGHQLLTRHATMPTSDVDLHNFGPTLLNATRGVEQEIIQMWATPQREWLTLFAIVFTLMCLDAAVSRKLASGFKTHLAMLVGWILCGLGYNVFYAMRYGVSDGMDWLIGYALEWMLSLDNLFAFQFILRTYRAPSAIQGKALLYGVLGSMVTRLMLFSVIGSMMRSIHYIQFVFGFILIYAGIQAVRDDDDGKDCSEVLFVRLLKKGLGSRLRDSYDLENHRLFVWDPADGRLCATLLVPLIFCVIVSDVIFAVDSVSAKVAQIPNQYIAYSSSVLALLGLRAMFFVIDDLVKYFELLKYGVCAILIFIGTELMIAGKFQLPDWVVLMVIISVLNVCVVASVFQKIMWRSPHKQDVKDAVETADPVPRVPEKEESPSRIDSPTEKCDAESPGQFDCQTEELRQKLRARFQAIEGEQSRSKDAPVSCSVPGPADSAAG